MKIDNYPMTENQILKKLRLTDQNPVLIINAPEEFQETQKHIRSDVHRQTSQQYGFILVFVKNQADINQFLPTSLSALQGDGYFWVAYPKKTSTKYVSDISRDKGWEILGKHNYEPVTQIAIDQDWSALRFRQADNIKQMKPKKALSPKGRERIKKK
jgi:hypothetical protein